MRAETVRLPSFVRRNRISERHHGFRSMDYVLDLLVLYTVATGSYRFSTQGDQYQVLTSSLGLLTRFIPTPMISGPCGD